MRIPSFLKRYFSVKPSPAQIGGKPATAPTSPPIIGQFIPPSEFRQSRNGFVGPGSVELTEYPGPRGWSQGITVAPFGGSYDFSHNPATPILTHQVYSCAAIVMVGPKGHYLGHLESFRDSLTNHYRKNISRIAESPDKIQQIYVLPGKGNWTMDTVNHILKDLQEVHPSLLGKLQFVHYPEHLQNPMFISYGGKVYAVDSNRELFKAGGHLLQPEKDPGKEDYHVLLAWRKHQNRPPFEAKPPVTDRQFSNWHEQFRPPGSAKLFKKRQ